MRFARFKGSSAPVRFTAALLTVLLAGCGGGDEQDAPDPIGSGDETGSSGSPSTLKFSAHSGTEKITLLWSGVEDIDILYSADRSCDWANYALCAGAGMVPNATGGRHVLTLAGDSHHTLTLAQDGVQPNINYFFVGESVGTRTPTVSARALVPSRDTHLAQLAASLEPGEFVRLDSKASEGEPSLAQLLSGFRPDGSGAPSIDTWTDSAHWDPLRQRTFFQGLRQSNRFISYDATQDVWEEFSLDQPNAPPLFERFGHLYGRTALDWERGHFYRLAGSTLHRYVIDEQRWEQFEDSPISGYISIDWHYGLDMLVGLSARELHGFRDGEWMFLGNAQVHGYHSSAKYNPVRGDMLFVGGNHSSSNVDLLTADGRVMHMRDAPFAFSISAENLTHDPQTGNYLVLHRDRKLWEYDPDGDEWRVAQDWSEGAFPLHRYHRHVPIPIDELGIIAWQVPGGLQLHRHRSAFSGREAADPDAAPPRNQNGSTPPPPSGSLAGTELQQEASNLAPGEWAWPLGADTFGGVWTHNTYANNSNDFWMPVAVWNPAQARMYGILDRTAGAHSEESVVILYYDAATDAWGNVEVPDLGGNFGSPHVYGRWAFDIGRQKLYRRTQGDVWELDLATHQWTNTGPRNSAWSDGIAIHEGTGELMYMDTEGVVYGWNPDNNKVRTIGQNPAANQRHSHGHYNAIRNEVCFSFGDGGDILTLVSEDGTVRAVDVPPEVRGGAGSATTFTFHDPISGNYLVYPIGTSGTRKMWEFDPDRDQWKMAFDFMESDVKWPPYHGHLIAPVPELGVILWIHRSTHSDNKHQRIYKHKSVL